MAGDSRNLSIERVGYLCAKKIVLASCHQTDIGRAAVRYFAVAPSRAGGHSFVRCTYSRLEEASVPWNGQAVMFAHSIPAPLRKFSRARSLTW